MVELLRKEAGEVHVAARHERGQDENVDLDYLLRTGRWARLYGFDLIVQGKISVRVRDWTWNEVEVASSPEFKETAERVQEQVRRWSAPLQLLCHFGLFVWVPMVAAFVIGWVQNREREANAAREKLIELVADRGKSAGWTSEQAEGVLREASKLVEQDISSSRFVSGVAFFLIGPVVGLLLARLKSLSYVADLLFLWWQRLFPAVYLDCRVSR